MTIHLAIVSREAGRYGWVVVTKSWEWPVRSVFVRLMYHFSALTGHHNLSFGTDENDLMSGTKMSGGKKESD